LFEGVRNVVEALETCRNLEGPPPQVSCLQQFKKIEY
jgi:hypothetical protein